MAPFYHQILNILGSNWGNIPQNKLAMWRVVFTTSAKFMQQPWPLTSHYQIHNILDQGKMYCKTWWITISVWKADEEKTLVSDEILICDKRTSSGRCLGRLWRVQRKRVCTLMWIPQHKHTFLHTFMVLFIYTTSPWPSGVGPLFHSKNDIPLIIVHTVERNIQLHPLVPDTWVNDFPRRIQSVIHTTMKSMSTMTAQQH